MITISELQKKVHATALEKGWWPLIDTVDKRKMIDFDKVNIPEKLMLMTTELGEAMEHYRNGVGMKEVVYQELETDTFLTLAELDKYPQYTLSNKPDGFAVELADVMIRILDYCAAFNIDIEHIIEVKANYNKTRPYRHGDKKC